MLDGVTLSDITMSKVKDAFHDHIVAQGATVDAFESKVDSIRSKHIRQLIANTTGHLYVDIPHLRQVFETANSIHSDTSNAFPDNIGMILCKQPGNHVHRGDLVATVACYRESLARSFSLSENCSTNQ